jgi:hypothetical protein
LPADIISDLELLSKTVSECKPILKFLRVVPHRYMMIAMAIDQNIDPKELSIEELIGHFHTVEESYDLHDLIDGSGKLRITEDECEPCMSTQLNSLHGGAQSEKGANTKLPSCNKPAREKARTAPANM